MKYSIQFVNIPRVPDAEALVSEKLDELAKKFEWVIRAAIFFKAGNEGEDKGCICEIRLSLPGPRIFASADENSFEAAIIETVSILERQLKKRKSEMYSQ